MSCFKKLNNKFLTYLLISITVITIGLHFRLYPITINLNRQNLSASRIALFINIKKTLARKINAAFPNLPQENKNVLINIGFVSFTKKDPEKLKALIDEFKSKNENSLYRYFLLGSDSYYFYYLTKEIVSHGAISKQIKNGSYFDVLMSAPGGHWRKIEAHPYFGFSIYKLFTVFSKDFSLLWALSIVPLILFTVSALIFILICLNLKIDKINILFSSLFFCLSPIFIQRSSFGWYDSDPYNILFLCLALFIILKLVKNETHIFWSLSLGFVTGLYSLFWQGWVLLPALSFSSMFFVLIIKVIEKQKFTILLKKIGLFSASFLIFAIIILSPKGFANSASDISSIIFGFFQLNSNLWPDIFLTVGELKSPNALKIIHTLGGYVFIGVAVLGFILLCFGRIKNSDKGQSIVIVVSTILCLLLTRNAERFVLFLLVPISICFALGINEIWRAVNTQYSKISKLRKNHCNCAATFTLSLLLISPFIYGHATSLSQVPLFNIVWKDSLEKIKNKTDKSAVVNSWWPPGHFIKAIAERRVTFDGATINTPQAYWMANFFLSNSEEEALGILRMLNTSSNEATEFMIDKRIPLQKAIPLLKEIIVKSKQSAKDTLKNYLDDKDIERILILTHSSPPPSYCLIYNEMVENALGLRFVKNWNFNKAFNIKKERYAALKKGKFFWRGTKDYIGEAWSVSGGPTYIGEESYEISTNNNSIRFANGVILDKELMIAKIDRLEDKISGVPHSLLYVKNNKLIEKKLENPTIKLSVLIIPHSNNSQSSIVAPAEVLKSILFRLYYLDGLGLKRFEKVIQEENPLLKTRIFVFKIIW